MFFLVNNLCKYAVNYTRIVILMYFNNPTNCFIVLINLYPYIAVIWKRCWRVIDRITYFMIVGIHLDPMFSTQSNALDWQIKYDNMVEKSIYVVQLIHLLMIEWKNKRLPNIWSSLRHYKIFFGQKHSSDCGFSSKLDHLQVIVACNSYFRQNAIKGLSIVTKLQTKRKRWGTNLKSVELSLTPLPIVLLEIYDKTCLMWERFAGITTGVVHKILQLSEITISRNLKYFETSGSASGRFNFKHFLYLLRSLDSVDFSGPLLLVTYKTKVSNFFSLLVSFVCKEQL